MVTVLHAVTGIMGKAYSYDKKFVEKNLIAYIGNKRRLLPLIIKAIREVETYGSVKIQRSGLFIDCFAGTGVVSRLAKSLGFSVIANDWEYYSYIINTVFVEYGADTLRVFDEDGGIEKVINELNELDIYCGRNAYISENYCPGSDISPDPNRERMFFTRQNGIIIDNIRAAIEARFPLSGHTSDNRSSRGDQGKRSRNTIKRHILTALLLYESSTRANTNGVFKAFHRGFGGGGGDALGRILKKVSLSKPVLINGTNCRAEKKNALDLLREVSDVQAEIVYLDPPYNQHQYGSNYHLLNTIARNDKPEIKREFIINGKKVAKSGIRKDWINTKSSFCSKSSAEHDFRDLIRSIHAKYILVSYSTEGIIPFDSMLDILTEKGKIGIVTSGYVRYRGGRQANTTKNKNIEFILMVNTAEHTCRSDIENVRGVILSNAFQNISEQVFPVLSPGINFRVKITGNNVHVLYNKNGMRFSLNKFLGLSKDFFSEINSLPYQRKKELFDDLYHVFFKRNDCEIVMLLKMLRSDYPADRRFLAERVITLFNKINPKKNHEEYQRVYSEISRMSDVLHAIHLGNMHIKKLDLILSKSSAA